MLNRRKSIGFIAATALALLSSCSPAPQLRVHDAVLVLNPVDQNPSALYFNVLGGDKDVWLLNVVSNSVIRSEMHESKMDPKTGAMTMDKIDRVKVPAKGKVEFKRGGKHVMMWGVNTIPRKTGEIEVTFIFSTGEQIEVTADVQKADGSPANQ